MPMRVKEAFEFERKVEEWDGKIALDTYHIEGKKGFVVLSLFKGNSLLYGLSFEGKRDEVVKILKEFLPQQKGKIVRQQIEDVEKIKNFIEEYPSE